MGEIVLIDTSVLMNVLDVPGFKQHRAQVLEEFCRLIEESAHIFLPMAAVLEAGNHIAQLPDGGLRRTHARNFADQIRKALHGEAPWRPMQFPDHATVATWLDRFPDAANGRPRHRRSVDSGALEGALPQAPAEPSPRLEPG